MSVPAPPFNIQTHLDVWTDIPQDATSFDVDSRLLGGVLYRCVPAAAIAAAGLRRNQRVSAVRTQNALVFTVDEEAGGWTLVDGKLKSTSEELFGPAGRPQKAYALDGAIVLPMPVLDIAVPRNETSDKWCRMHAVNLGGAGAKERVHEFSSTRLLHALGLKAGTRFDVLWQADHVWLHPNENGAVEVTETSLFRFSRRQLFWFRGPGKPRIVAFEQGWAITNASGTFGTNRCAGEELTPTSDRVLDAWEEDFAPVRRKQPNLSEYPAYPGERLQVAGAWLREFGFVPGVRYREETNPIYRNRMMLVLDERGEHQVTAMSPGSTAPKLYVSAEALAHVKRGRVRVFGTTGSLQVSGAGTVPFVGRTNPPKTTAMVAA